MLFKRYIFLAACVILFLGVYVGHFYFARSAMEGQFQSERAKYGVDGTVLTASDSSQPAAPAPVAPSPDSAAAPLAPAPPPAPDTNTLIGPVPPSAPDTSSPDNSSSPSAPTPPDSTPPSAPTPPDSNSIPTTPPVAPTPPPSTMNEPRPTGSPFRFASYQPADGIVFHTAEFQTALNPAPPPAPPAPVATTNAAPVIAPADAGPARPVPVEASVIVLGYHQFVGPGQSSKNIYVMKQDVFESEMKYLKDNGYHVVPLADVVKFIKGQIGLPPNSVAITIDDGYKSAIVWAAPVLKKYGYPWTYFVYPDFITVNEGVGAASWNDLLALQADGVDIESHSMTHPMLTKHHQQIKGVWHTFTDTEYDAFLTNETAGSKALLEKKLGKPVLYFAYPYGDWNKVVQAKAIAAGYDAIFTVAGNPVHTTTDKSSVGRYVITQPDEKNFASFLRQGALSVAEADPAPGATISNPRPLITAVLGYVGNLDPKSIETEVRNYGVVRHDFDPKTSTIRLYLARDLVQSTVAISIRVKDADSGQTMVASWHFNYEPAAAGAVHPPIATATNAPPVAVPVTAPKIVAATNAPAAVQPDPPAKTP